MSAAYLISTGKVVELYPHKEQVFIRLSSMPQGVEHYALMKSHANYEALLAVSMLAATKDWDLTVRAENGSQPPKPEVGYVSAKKPNA